MRGNGLPGMALLAAGCLLVGCAGGSADIATTRSAGPTSPPTAAVPAPTASTDAEGDSVVLSAARDAGAYGFDADLVYVSATAEHVLSASMTADGMTLRAELYQQGVDDDGPPQHPQLKAGEHLGITTFTVPECSTPTLGASPLLTVTLVDASGTQVTRQIPVGDPKGQIAAVARAWCGHGVLAALDGLEGGPNGAGSVCFDTADFTVRNPTALSATVTVDGTDYAAAPVTLPPGGSATLHLTRTPSCTTSSSKAIATVLLADGGTSKLDLPFS